MAWGSLGSLGTVNSKTASQTSLVLTTVNIAEAGNVVVLLVAVDNAGTADGDEGAVSSVTDSAGGNTWTKAREFVNGQGAAQAGAVISVWFSKLTNQIPNAGTITANFQSSANRDASAASAWEFSIGAGNVVTVETGANLANDGADPGSMDLTTPNAEFLWVRGIAKEGVIGTWTKTVAYDNTIPRDGTSGGAAASNMSVAGEFDVFTGTTNPSDPTWTAANDHASVLVALKEAAGGATISPSAIGSAEAFGTAKEILSLPIVGGLATGEAFGSTRQVFLFSPASILSAEVFGTAKEILILLPSGLASGEAIGSHTVQGGAVIISPTGIVSQEAFGTHKQLFRVTLVGITSAEAFGVAKQILKLLGLGAIPSGEIFGSHRQNFLVTGLTGIPSAEIFGIGKLVFIIQPSGMASGEAFGTASFVGTYQGYGYVESEGRNAGIGSEGRNAAEP